MSDLDYESEETQREVAVVANPSQALGDSRSAAKLINGLRASLERILMADSRAIQRFTMMALTTLRENEDLAKCDQLSFTLAILRLAEMGLYPGSVTGHGYLVPFSEKGRALKKVVLIPGYKGYVACAFRSGLIKDIQANVIHEGDEWDYELGSNPHILHRPSRNGSGAAIAWYVVVRLKDGGEHPRLMHRPEIEHYRNFSKAKDSFAWKDHYDPMALKTVFKREQPWIPLSFELAALNRLDRESEIEDKDEVKYKLRGEKFMGTETETVGKSVSDIATEKQAAAFTAGAQRAKEATAPAAKPAEAPKEPNGRTAKAEAPVATPKAADAPATQASLPIGLPEDDPRAKIISKIYDLNAALADSGRAVKITAKLESLDMAALEGYLAAIQKRWEKGT